MTLVHQCDAHQAQAGQPQAMQVVIGGACLFFIWYAWTMSKKRVLR